MVGEERGKVQIAVTVYMTILMTAISFIHYIIQVIKTLLSTSHFSIIFFIMDNTYTCTLKHIMQDTFSPFEPLQQQEFCQRGIGHFAFI